MKVGSKPGGPVEWLLVNANRIPTPLIDSFSAMMNAKAILAANELGVFAALNQGPLTITELSSRLNSSERGIADLTDTLRASGYLARKGDRVSLTRVSRKWLVASSPHYIGNMMNHINDLWAVWLNLEEAVRKGSPPGDQYSDWLGDRRYESLLRRHIVGLRDVAKITAPEMVRALRLPANASRLLDIGGGHGGYSIALCQKHPRLSATVFDLEPTARIGREIVALEQMGERVNFRVGDFLNDDLGSGYDAALYFNIVHNFSEEDNRRVLPKIFAALNPGGTVAVWDMFKEGEGERDVLPALMALHMLVASGGTSYQLDDVKRWLIEAGFATPVRKVTRTAPGLSLLIARKP